MNFLDTIPRVKEHCKEHGLNPILAADNGSHSWGYSGPKSDWDIKFVYTHPRDKYLSLEEPMQHTSFKGDNVEYVGYDLKKFLGLLWKGNAGPYEIVFSTYQEHFGSKDGDTLRRFTLQSSQDNLNRVLAHYCGLAGSTLKNSGEPTLKKWCYILRPLLMVEYIHHNKFLPLLDFKLLIDFCLIDKLIPLEIHVALDTIIGLRQTGVESLNSPQLDFHLGEYAKERLAYWFDYLESGKNKSNNTENLLTVRDNFDKMFRELIKE